MLVSWPKRPPAPDFEYLLPSWQLALRADRKIRADGQDLRRRGALLRSPGVRRHDARTARTRQPAARGSPHCSTAARRPATARSRQLAVRRFTSWLADEGEIPLDPFLGIKAPKLDTKIVEPLTEEELRALLKACAVPKGATPAEAMRHRRDEALLRLMLETGARAGEVVAIELPDLDLQAGTAIIRKGKGGKGRVVPFGPHTALALDRYLRLRKQHRLADSPALWLGDRGKGFTYDALHQALGARAAADEHRGVPPAQDAAYRGPPVARCWWFRGRVDGRGRVDTTRHVDALHACAGQLARGRRSTSTQLGRTLTRPACCCSRRVSGVL